MVDVTLGKGGVTLVPGTRLSNLLMLIFVSALFLYQSGFGHIIIQRFLMRVSCMCNLGNLY